MINWIIALAAGAMWVSAFMWYFAPDIRRSWERRKQRRAKPR
jgi:hypothetical protein